MSLPLDGIRVLDLSRLLPGPFCTMYLADMGAEVIKIEDTVQGDYIRWLPPYIGKRSARFIALNRNKKSVTLNLKEKKGVELFLKLVETADVVVESFRPGVLDKLGAGYEEAKKVNPGIIYCALTGFGQTGPYAQWAGHDLNFISYTGVLSMNSSASGKPMPPGTQIGDLSGAMNAVIGILSALLQKRTSGEGCFVDVALSEGAMFMLPMTFGALQAGETMTAHGHRDLTGGQPCYDVYETSDGKYVALGAIEPKFFKKFCALCERPDLEILHFATGKDGEKLRNELTALFKTRTSQEWLTLLEEQDVCFSPVKNPEEALTDPHLIARQVMVKVPVDEMTTVEQPSLPFKMSGHNSRTEHAAPPDFGADTGEYLSEIGVSENELKELRKNGIII